MNTFAGDSLRELRIRAGLTQKALAQKSGVSQVTVSFIETGRSKPYAQTWRKLLKALSGVASLTAEEKKLRMSPDAEALARVREVSSEPGTDFFGETLNRDEFLRRLKMKMSQSMGALFNHAIIVKTIEAADFFSRQRYYPGDFATAIEIMAAVLRTQKKDGDGKRGQTHAPFHRRRRLNTVRKLKGI